MILNQRIVGSITFFFGEHTGNETYYYDTYEPSSREDFVPQPSVPPQIHSYQLPQFRPPTAPTDVRVTPPQRLDVIEDYSPNK